jgi:pimeloyl-ACP methyl ester carboxylesterase
LPDPSPTDLDVVSSGGVSLAAVEAGDPEGQTVILIHGYPDTKSMWLPVIDRLAPEFHVVAYDVRGAGGSSAPRGSAAYRLSALAEDFAAVREAVAGPRPVHLVGHDWGGVQGWEFVTAARFEGLIASFTTIAGPALGHAVHAARAPLSDGRVGRSLGRLRRSWYVVPLCLPGGPTLTWRLALGGDRWRRALATVDGVPVDDDYPASTIVQDGLHGANLYRANIARRMLQPPALGAPHAPVQLLVPTRDRFIPESYYDAARRLAPDLRAHTVPGSHWAPRCQPDLVAGRIAEFVRDVV